MAQSKLTVARAQARGIKGREEHLNDEIKNFENQVNDILKIPSDLTR